MCTPHRHHLFSTGGPDVSGSQSSLILSRSSAREGFAAGDEAGGAVECTRRRSQEEEGPGGIGEIFIFVFRIPFLASMVLSGVDKTSAHATFRFLRHASFTAHTHDNREFRPF